jgi:hypothetical protein
MRLSGFENHLTVAFPPISRNLFGMIIVVCKEGPFREAGQSGEEVRDKRLKR